MLLAKTTNFIFEVYQSVSNDGSDDPVVSVTQNGKVVALKGGSARIRVYVQNNQ